MVIATHSPPLVGREAELKALEHHLDEGMAGRGGLVLVSGEAGIGKTSLLNELAKLAAKEGAHVVMGQCMPGGSIPYLPFQDALAKVSLPGKKELGLRGWLIGSETGAYEPWGLGVAPELESGRTPYIALEFFRELCKRRTLVVVLDDLQWADSASIQLLHFLARNCRELRMVILGSYRPEDLSIDQHGRAHSLPESLRAMRREGIVHEVRLDGLTMVNLEKALGGLQREKIDTELLRRLAKESGGNPLYAVEAFRLLLQTKSIDLKNGVWTSDTLVKIDIPPTVREVLLGRVARLSKDERSIIEVAAVAGERFDPELLSRVLGVEKLAVLEFLDSIRRVSRLVEEAEGMFRFSHEKVREATYEEISPLRRNEIHRRIGEALETSASAQTYGTLSTHFYHAGELAKCVKYSVLAGQDALDKFALREASEHFRTVIELAKDSSALLDDRLRALEGIADSHVRLGNIDQAKVYYKNFLEHCRTAKERARILRKLAEAELWPRTAEDLTEATRLLGEAERNRDLDPVEIARIKFGRGYIAHVTGALNESERLYSEVRLVLEQTGSLADLANVVLQEALLFLSLGRVKDALSSSVKAEEVFRNLRNPLGESFTQYAQGVAYFHLGLVQEALSHFARGEEISSKFGALGLATYIMRGFLYYGTDDFDAARKEAVGGINASSKSGHTPFRGAGHTLLALCEARAGRTAEAERVLAEAVRETGSISPKERFPFRAYLEIAQAEIHATKKEWAPCNKKFEEGIHGLASSVYGVLFEALARTRYGEAFARQGRMLEAEQQFGEASRLYEKLGNTSQAGRVGKLALAQYGT